MMMLPSKNRLYQGALVLLFSALLGGCSWSWLPWVDAPEKDLTKPAKLVDFKAEVKLTREWRASIGEGLGKKYLRLRPALLADRIIAADGYGEVEARDRFSGKRLWRTQTHKLDAGFFSALNFLDRRDPSFVAGGVGIASGLVLLGTTLGEVVALDAGDGAERWRTALGSEVLSVPSASRDSAFVQTIDGRLVALSIETGEEQWSFDNQVPILTLRGTSSPIFADNIVYTGFANGEVAALRAETGEPLWEHRVMLPEGRSELERMVDVDAAPLVSGANVYVGAFQGRVKSLSRRDGRPLWEHEISTFLDLATGYGQVYVVDDKDVISAIDQSTGEVTWTQEDFQRRKLSAPIAFSNYLAFGDDAGYLHVIAQRDGRHLGRRKLDGDGIRSGMVYSDSTLYVLGNSGSLHALQIELN